VHAVMNVFQSLSFRMFAQASMRKLHCSVRDGESRFLTAALRRFGMTEGWVGLGAVVCFASVVLTNERSEQPLLPQQATKVASATFLIGQTDTPSTIGVGARAGDGVNFRIEFDRDDDGRWIAEISELPGVMAYGATKAEAEAAVEALALRVIADRIELEKVGQRVISFASA